jgi:hypothetical protein
MGLQKERLWFRVRFDKVAVNDHVTDSRHKLR